MSTLREKIEGLHVHGHSIVSDPLISRRDALALLAERGAATREPDGWTWAEPDNLRLAPKPVHLVLREERAGMYPVYIGEAPQGATGTAQPIAATLEEQPFSDEAGLRFVRDMASDLFDNRLGWSDGRNPYAPRELWANLGAALYGEDDPRVTELRSPQPAEPRELVNEVVIPLEGSDPDALAEILAGGDTLTPEPETAQIVEALRRPIEASRRTEWTGDYYQMRGPALESLAKDRLSAADRLEEQAARIAALRLALHELWAWGSRGQIAPWSAVKAAHVALSESALVGEEAP